MHDVYSKAPVLDVNYDNRADISWRDRATTRRADRPARSRSTLHGGRSSERGAHRDRRGADVKQGSPTRQGPRDSGIPLSYRTGCTSVVRGSLVVPRSLVLCDSPRLRRCVFCAFLKAVAGIRPARPALVCPSVLPYPPGAGAVARCASRLPEGVAGALKKQLIVIFQRLKAHSALSLLVLQRKVTSGALHYRRQARRAAAGLLHWGEPRLHEPRLDQAPNRAKKRKADAIGQILRLPSCLRQERADDRHRYEEEEVVEQEAVEQCLVRHLCQDVVALCGWCTQEPPRLCYLRDHGRHRDLVRRHRQE